MKNIIFIIFLFFIYSCGYTSVYKKFQGQNFDITITKMQGDRNMNNLIKNELDLYSNESADKKFDVTINTVFKKKIITKNSAGVITDYELLASSTFSVLHNGQTQLITLRETINVKNISDNFEQSLYERNVKKNFASSIREKLMLKILNMK